MAKIFLGLIFFFLFSLFLQQPVFAVTVSLSNPPSAVTEDPFSFTVQISGASTNTVNYLRMDLYKAGTTNYFGFTYNGNDFYNGSDYKQYLPVSIAADGSASQQVQGRVDTASSYFKGPGDYMLRVRRYTASGNYSAQEANAGAVSLIINISSTPTPTPTPTTTQSSSKTPTPAPKTTTTAVKTSQPVKTAQPQILGQKETVNPTASGIAVEQNFASPSFNLATRTPQIQESSFAADVVENKKSNWWMFLAIFGGLVILTTGGFLLIKRWKQ